MAELVPAIGFGLAYLGLSLFDPWRLMPSLVHGLAFISLVVIVAASLVRAFTAIRRGYGEIDIRWGRYTLLLPLLTVGFFAAGSDWDRRLVVAFKPGLLFGAPDMALVAIIEPPAYTGKPLITLPISPKPGSDPVVAPIGSSLRVTARDTRWPPLLGWGRESVPFRPMAGDSKRDYGIEAEIKADGDVRVTFAGKTLAAWTIQILPDQIPQIVFSDAPAGTVRHSLRLPITASDDYGIEYLALKLKRADGAGVDHVVDLPAYGVALQDDVLYPDLTGHPLAGEEVTLSVIAVDGFSQEAETPAVTITLPKRKFANPLALSLASTRSALLSGSRNDIEQAVRRLNGLSESAAFPADATVHLGVRTAYLRLRAARTEEDLTEIANLLWDLALRAEDGTLSIAESELNESLGTALMVLRRGGSPDQVRIVLSQFAHNFETYGRAQAKRAAATAKGPQRDGMDWAAVQRMFARLDDQINQGEFEAVTRQLMDLQAGLEERPDLLLSTLAYRRFVVASYARRLLDEVVREQKNLISLTANPIFANPTTDALAVQRQRLTVDQTALRDAVSSLITQLNRAGLPDLDPFMKARKAMDDAIAALSHGASSETAAVQLQALTALDQASRSLADIPVPVTINEDGSYRDPLGRPLPPASRDTAPVLDPAKTAPRPSR